MQIKNVIFYFLKTVIRSSNLLVDTIFMHRKKNLPFFSFIPRVILDIQEIPVYIDNFIFGDILEPVYLSYFLSQANPVIIDLGCHTGMFAEYLLRLNPHVQYYGFDMMQECIKKAEKRLTKYKNAYFFNFALGSENKRVEIFFSNTIDSSNSVLNSRGSIRRKIEMRRLDDVTEIKNTSKIDLLKIDVEGYELFVLTGASETLKKSKFVIIELHLEKHLKDFSEINLFLTKCGHILYKVRERNLYFKNNK